MRRVFSFGAILLAAAIAPMSVQGGNQEKAEDIASVLQDNNLIDGCDIGLKYQNETVWLTGVVDSAEKASAIQAEVEKMEGVSSVVNQLEVEKAVVDESVQQVAGYQRAGARRPAQLMDLREEQIVSDEVVAVNGVPVGQTQAQPQVANALPSVVENGNSVLVSEPSVMHTASMQSRPRPITQAAYGTTVKSSVVEGPITSAAPSQYVSRPCPTPMSAQSYSMPANGGAAMRYDEPYMPNKAWPSYASYPNTAAVQYPKRHGAGAWPYIGPYYPYPQVPDGWRRVTLEWHDGYWHLDFDDGTVRGPFNGLFRQKP